MLLSYETVFRNVIKDHLAKLLRSKNLYWRKRYTVNRVKFGDECTNFFHAMATISYRRNTISQLQNENGVTISDHDGKASLLWTAYKNRMGVTMHPEMRFNLVEFIHVNTDLASLLQPISREEVDRVVKLFPSDKALGPDGFNGLFLKKCWPVVKESFYQLCDDFYNGILNLESINSSFITLVPKILNPVTVNDFRPISLLNRSIKLITKILAERLLSIILEFIHANQYGFIRSRTI